ncbi:acetate--CoA ligase family protein [Mesoterricola silvestris]|uniref:CoA-binding protein n=1 Tax=Mesoterricola silvestris TaxID=2927979 RepID=A0AA48GX00_9BACT|nr:acetate--CoA ligase family protein [Mesoterricola silvestris]BDU73411.1 CoA-binding protein [Mesoterricola silvestris]
MSTFIHELEAYDLLELAGLPGLRRGLVRSRADVDRLPFKAGEKVVLKGVAQDVWHKSDVGLVRFEAFDAEAVWAHAQDMEKTAGGPWVGMLVVEMVDFRKVAGLPTEALVALRRTPEAGWTVVLGIGGLHTNAWGEEIRPCLWPLSLVTPEQALADFKAHYLGRVWLGTLRQGKPLTTEGAVLSYLRGLWTLADLLDSRKAELLEMNPVVLDPEGRPVALDGVGSLGAPAPEAPKGLAPSQLLDLLVKPRTIALAGISARPGTPGRMILDNLLTSTLDRAAIIPIKPGTAEIDGLPCLGGVEDLAARPVDMLILCLPAAQTVAAIQQLCEQGGGAQVVYLVPGGVGDGADTEGRGAFLTDLLARRRAQGLWTPALVGPNGLGFLSSEGRVNTLFIPQEKLPVEARGGALSLVSQSGAFLISRLSSAPELPLRYAVSIGNQIDVRLSDFIAALGDDAQTRVIATYVEGFQPGDLLATAKAAREVIAKGKWVVLYKGGRSSEGQKAASSHTGALAGDWALQKALLKRAGIIVCESMGVFDAALAWVSAFPAGKPSRVAVISNAGYESVVSADLLEGAVAGHVLADKDVASLKALLETHKLTELVNPRLPLDVTPMADGAAYLDSARLIAATAADTLVIGLVPFTRRLDTTDPAAMDAFAGDLAAIARDSGKRVGVAVEGGALYGPYREALAKAGLPVFLTMEKALQGLRILAEA